MSQFSSCLAHAFFSSCVSPCFSFVSVQLRGVFAAFFPFSCETSSLVGAMPVFFFGCDTPLSSTVMTFLTHTPHTHTVSRTLSRSLYLLSLSRFLSPSLSFALALALARSLAKRGGERGRGRGRERRKIEERDGRSAHSNTPSRCTKQTK